MSFVRDAVTQAIINTDDTDYKRILVDREKDAVTRRLAEEVSVLKDDITDIKSMLLQIINGSKNV